jgi:hypothetical protein
MDRLAEFTRRADAEPRLASLSLVAGPTEGWLRATGPAGAVTLVALDLADLVGDLPVTDADSVAAWCRSASRRGLWHDWRTTRDADVARAPVLLEPGGTDLVERDDPSAAQSAAFRRHVPRRGRLTITVDATWLGPHETGAQVLTTAALAALARRSDVAAIRLIGIPELPAYAAHLGALETISVAGAGEGTTDVPVEGMTDVIWYPNQIDARSHIAEARRLGHRVITTYLDLIAYDIPGYHGSEEAWHAYRGLQRRIALSVDGITTISADVAERLLIDVPRLEPRRVRPIPLGLDHITAATAPEQPDADLADLVAGLGRRRFVLVLGNDFVHKNRDFAIRVWERALQAGQPCDLVLAGLHVRSSSSKAAEDDLVARHLDLRGRVHTVGHVSSASRAWLLANATAVLYPTSAEGFGFVPYEAAVLGTPTTFTDFGPLREIAAADGLPRGWSIDDHAQDLIALLADEGARRARLDALGVALGQYTWDAFADAFVSFAQEIIDLPEVPASAVGADSAAADAAALSAILSSRTWRATAPLRRMGGRIRRR